MPASVDSIPTSANQEDHVSMAAHGARRLLPDGGQCRPVVGIEMLAAAQGCDFHGPLTSSARSGTGARTASRAGAARSKHDRKMAPDIATATEMVHNRRIDRRRQVSLHTALLSKAEGLDMPKRLDNDRIIRARAAR